MFASFTVIMTANSNGDYVIRVNSALFTLAFIAVLLRSVSKWRSGLWFGADDWWIVTSLVPLGALLGVDIWGTLIQKSDAYVLYLRSCLQALTPEESDSTYGC